MDEIIARVGDLESRVRLLSRLALALAVVVAVLAVLLIVLAGRELPRDLTVDRLNARLVQARLVLVGDDPGRVQAQIMPSGFSVFPVPPTAGAYMKVDEKGQPQLNLVWKSRDNEQMPQLVIGADADGRPQVHMFDGQGNGIGWNGE